MRNGQDKIRRENTGRLRKQPDAPVAGAKCRWPHGLSDFSDGGARLLVPQPVIRFSIFPAFGEFRQLLYGL